VFEKYCPNLMKYLAEHPEVDKMIRTDEGSYYVFPFLRGDRVLQTSVGPIVRADWLKDFGMEPPVTLDDWYTYLTKAKEEKGATAPYTHIDWLLNELPFAYAYGLRLDFFLDEVGKVQYGPYTPQYKDFLALMNKWYTEKLIDPDIATMTQTDILSAKVTNGSAAALHGYAGSSIGTYMNVMKDTDPNYSLIGTMYPVLNAGDAPKMGHVENAYTGTAAAAITTSCQNVEAAARLLDYMYSEEGMMYYNFGVEGVSYTMVDGQPVYTDLILKNPEGRSVAEAMSANIRGSYNGPGVQDVRYIWQFLQLPQQVDAYKNWAKTDADKYLLPPISATPEESTELAAIMSEVDAYFKEMYYKFMFGTESLDNFDTYMENLKALGIERALEIKEAGLARYNAR
jgi:putative aldouronate transport system substrate-binding protein